MGRSGCGKTTLTQALRGETITYHKTQHINHFDVIIDTPGEYAENHTLGRALALYSYEADVVGLLLSATEPYSLYPPCITLYGQSGGNRYRNAYRLSRRSSGSGGGLAASCRMQDNIFCKFKGL